MKYVAEVRKRFSSAPAFTLTDLRVFLAEMGISAGYLHLLVHHFLSRGEARRIARGVYTFRDDAQVAGFGFRPFYYGLQDALSLRNLWEQETNPVVITPRKVRAGMRKFEGSNYVVRRISRSMFFGHKMEKYSDFWIPVSDVEKTLIDFAYFKEPLEKEALKEIGKRADERVLAGYLLRCPKWVKKRVGKMLEGV